MARGALRLDGGMQANGCKGSRSSFTADESRRIELERALSLLNAGKDPVQVIESLSHRLTNKLLHAPLKVLAA